MAATGIEEIGALGAVMRGGGGEGAEGAATGAAGAAAATGVGAATTRNTMVINKLFAKKFLN